MSEQNNLLTTQDMETQHKTTPLRGQSFRGRKDLVEDIHDAPNTFHEDVSNKLQKVADYRDKQEQEITIVVSQEETSLVCNI